LYGKYEMNVQVTQKEFTNIIISFLLDKMMKQEKIVSDDTNLKELIALMERQGMKGFLLKKYLSFSSEERTRFKNIKVAFDEGFKGANSIMIKNTPDIVQQPVPEQTQKTVVDKVKNVVKKTLKTIKKVTLRSGLKPIKESTLDKIIEKHILEESNENG
jgi:hypothetical protein